jgi:hypothetical protein
MGAQESHTVIPLSKGAVALVDEADSHLVSHMAWHLGSTGYALHSVSAVQKVAMHTLIMGSTGVDHINRNKLDNRRNNLRIATRTQNEANKPGRAGSSKFKGVHAKSGKWAAQIGHGGKKIHIGLFPTEITAAYAYNKKASELFGEFAYLNEVKQ